MSRPGAIFSNDNSSATRTASGTSPMRATSGPKKTRRVAAATAPSTGKADSAGRSGAPIGHRWSKTNTPSRPSSSARRAAAMAAAS